LVNAFRYRGNPNLIFGAGSAASLPELILREGPVLILTGGHFLRSRTWSLLETEFTRVGIAYERETIGGEPSPDTVDSLVEIAREAAVVSVLAIGGGSVLDAGKAVAAMVCHEGSVAEYLEGVGSLRPNGRTLPMIAAPTTAGTGSEATKNAVISKHGDSAFKKSLRHDAFVPATALIDPELALGCPMNVTLACGIDALCQLIESYVSNRATLFTDMLAKEGLRLFGSACELLSTGNFGTEELNQRGGLALAAYFSGLCLANAGLGTIHGLAGPLGAHLKVPHGLACALLAVPVLSMLIKRLSQDGNQAVLDKLAFTGAQIDRGPNAIPIDGDVKLLINHLGNWTGKLGRLADYGLERSDIDHIVKASDNKNSPVAFSDSERREFLLQLV